MGVLRDVDEDVRVELDLVQLVLVEIDLELLDLVDGVEDWVDLVFELVIVIWNSYQTLSLDDSLQVTYCLGRCGLYARACCRDERLRGRQKTRPDAFDPGALHGSRDCT